MIMMIRMIINSTYLPFQCPCLQSLLSSAFLSISLSTHRQRQTGTQARTQAHTDTHTRTPFPRFNSGPWIRPQKHNSSRTAHHGQAVISTHTHTHTRLIVYITPPPPSFSSPPHCLPSHLNKPHTY